MKFDKYPTLHGLGLGPALDEIERVCAIGAVGKYAVKKIDGRWAKHLWHAECHIDNLEPPRSLSFGPHHIDHETGERHLAHAAARLLMALAVSR